MSEQHLADELRSVSWVLNLMLANGNNGTPEFRHLMERAETLKELIEVKRRKGNE